MSGGRGRHLTLLAATHYPPMAGGSSRSCALLWRETARRGHRMVVLGPITDAERAYDTRQAADTPPTLAVERYDVPHFHLAPYSIEDFRRFQAIEHAAVRARLPALVDRHRPDVVVAAHETLAEPVLDIARAKGLPCAVMLRGSPTWQIVTDQYPEDASRAYLDLYRRADVVIAVARYMRDGLAFRGVDGVVPLPNFVDRRAFAPGPRDPGLAARYGIAANDLVVLHASVMTSRKRPEDVLRAAALTLPQDERLLFLFVGGEDRGRALEEESRRLGLATRVRFVDRVPYHAMPDHVRLADLVVVPSAGEGLARIYLETQACARVLVASDIPAAREVVEHDATGLLFPVASAEALAGQILRASADAVLRARIGAAARERTAEHDIARVVDAYLDVFDGLAPGGDR